MDAFRKSLCFYNFDVENGRFKKIYIVIRSTSIHLPVFEITELNINQSNIEILYLFAQLKPHTLKTSRVRTHTHNEGILCLKYAYSS